MFGSAVLPTEPGDVCWKAEMEGKDRSRGPEEERGETDEPALQSRATGAPVFTAQTSRVQVFLFHRLACAHDVLRDMLGADRPRLCASVVPAGSGLDVDHWPSAGKS